MTPEDRWKRLTDVVRQFGATGREEARRTAAFVNQLARDFAAYVGTNPTQVHLFPYDEAAPSHFEIDISNRLDAWDALSEQAANDDFWEFRMGLVIQMGPAPVAPVWLVRVKPTAKEWLCQIDLSGRIIPVPVTREAHLDLTPVCQEMFAYIEHALSERDQRGNLGFLHFAGQHPRGPLEGGSGS